MNDALHKQYIRMNEAQHLKMVNCAHVPRHTGPDFGENRKKKYYIIILFILGTHSPLLTLLFSPLFAVE